MYGIDFAGDLTVADLLTHKVTDGDFTCDSCGPAGQHREGRLPATAPVCINGKNYCLWCALRIACDLLEKGLR